MFSKGGTSLSKAYKIIDRFSEDIDLSMSRKITESEKKKTKELIIDIANNLGLVLSNEDKAFSRYDYNKYVFKYVSLFNDFPMELIIETSFYQSVYPTNMININNYVSSYFIENNIDQLIDFEWSNFKMNVQALERTLVDKVFAVCDYKIQNMMERDSRHLYDIAKIIPNIKIDENLKELIINVRKDRMKSKNNPSASLEYNITELLKEIVENHFYESDYKNITEKLLYEKYSYEEAINNGIKKVIDLNCF